MKGDSEVLENLSKKKKNCETNSRDVGLSVARAAVTLRPGKRIRAGKAQRGAGEESQGGNGALAPCLSNSNAGESPEELR